MQLEEYPSKLPTLESLNNKQPNYAQARRKESLNKSISSQKLKNSVVGDKAQGGASKSQIRMKKLKSERNQRDRGPTSALPDVNKKKLDLNGLLLDSIRKTRDIRVAYCLTSQQREENKKRLEESRQKDLGMQTESNKDRGEHERIYQSIEVMEKGLATHGRIVD